MRKVYHTDLKKKKIRQDAMDQWRRTREAIDPALLERTRALIEAQAAGETDYADEVPIDRKKNLMTIIKFMELKPGASALRAEIYGLITAQN